MLVHQPNLDSAQEVPVQCCVDNEDKNFGDLVPYIVDLDEGVVERGVCMRRDPDAEDGNVDGSDEDEGTPFEFLNRTAVLGDECNSIDDDLHEQLNLKHPEEQDGEQDWYTVKLRVSRCPL